MSDLKFLEELFFLTPMEFGIVKSVGIEYVIVDIYNLEVGVHDELFVYTGTRMFRLSDCLEWVFYRTREQLTSQLRKIRNEKTGRGIS